LCSVNFYLCVKSANIEYSQWPEKVRATLLVTAMNTNGYYWNSNTDGKDGAGAVSGIDAVTFAQNHTIVTGPGNLACINGQYAGSMTIADQNVNKTFNIGIPSTLPSGKHLRIVLTWDSSPDLTTTWKNYLSNLDLFAYNTHGALVGMGGSWDGNVEMTDVPQSSCIPGAVYTAIVSPSTIRIPAGARYQGFYYCIAWTWVKDHAP
jgi:hypothetical protein